MTRIVYLSPSSELHGGIRVLFEHAEGLAGRGWEVTVAGPDPPPGWYDLGVPYEQRPIFEPGGVPRAEVCVGTFYTTLGPARASGAAHVFHLCQGWEGIHREYAPILHEIDAAYRLPVPKLLVSEHLRPILEERYGCRTHVVGQAIDHEIFRPGPCRDDPLRAGADDGDDAVPFRVGLVGPFGLRPKGIGEALEGIRRAEEALGSKIEVHRASSLPYSDEERELGITDVFHHHLTAGEMARFYHRVDALVFPSHDEEGFGLPTLEAMACGVPVAASDIRPLRVLGGAVTRFLPGDPDAIARAVERLTQPATRRRLHAAGLETARRFHFDAVVDRIEAAFAAEGVPSPAAEATEP